MAASPGSTTTTASTRAPHFLLRTFQAFRYRDFRLMWSGAFTSTTGTWMQNVAQSWVVLQMAGTRALGLIGFLQDLPILLFTLIGGVAADRFDRRKQLLGSQYVQMTSAFILTLLVLFHRVHVWHFMVLAVCVGIAQSFGGPAYQALIPGLVERKDVPNAIALNSIQFNLARVIGPLLAGVTFAAVGAVMCFFLNGISFIAVIISLYIIKATFLPQKTGESVREGIQAGFSYVKQQGSLWQLSALGFISTFCGIPLLTLLPVFAKDIFHTGATGYANMLATSGAGAITGALLYAGMSHHGRQGSLALLVQVLLAGMLAAFALSRSLILSYIILFCGGVFLITLFASITSLVQMATTEEMRGRVMSIFMLAFRGGMPLGNLALVAYVAPSFSAPTALLAGSVLLGTTAVGFFLFSSIRKM